MPHSRVIVGVVGGHSQPTLAEHIGKEIADKDQILLTGGRPGAGGAEAKDRAMDGAVNFASNKAGKVARIISVLPENPPTGRDVLWSLEISAQRRAVSIHTRLSSHQRDFINGVTPDVLITLRGGPGTLAEIVFAAFTGVPVVFVDSFDQLRAKLDDAGRLEAVQKIIDEARQEYPIGGALETASVVTGLQSLLAKPGLTVPPTGNLADDAEKTVSLALAHAKSSATSALNKFPGIKSYPNSAQEFERLLGIVDA